MNIDEIKDLLPHGSYQKIAGTVGVTKGTVKHFFAKSEVRISARTRERILEAAKSIIMTNSLNGLELLLEDAKMESVKAAMAA